ncbi:Rh-like protein/ammonium transporter [Lojkania enalia]|uniref:Rh-like protein/ammonium transporter n=1 Tax=Lojkania enalia TaxID=147567 RepID=A0A9P4TPS1_9PLEO|nr:Rh-like protein/ammonium transporter [Didymosphaeria enalia]
MDESKPTFSFDVAPGNVFNVTATADKLEESPGLFYDAADMVWMMISSALVFLMVLGVGLLYSGTSRRSAIHMIWMPVFTSAIVALIWFLWGYAIAFSPSRSGFWGGTSGIAFHEVLVRPSGNDFGPRIPELVYALFHGMFASFSAVLVSGATVYKERTLRWTIFVVCWVTFIYCPIAHSSWSPEGAANKWGALDFAGGTPVHIVAGTSALAYALFYRLNLYRYNSQQETGGLPQSPAPNWMPKDETGHLPTILSGTILLWIGWFGFNGGSALGANMRAVSAIVSTQLAACAGGVTSSVLDSIYNKHFKRLIIAFCNGAVAGMVAVTPAAGFIAPYFAPLFGFASAISTSYAIRLSKKVFDALDIFAIHAVGGFVGMILTAFFASSDIVALDGYNNIPGGWIDHHWVQLGYQLADALAGMAYSFAMTFAILCILNLNIWKKPIKKPILVFD